MIRAVTRLAAGAVLATLVLPGSALAAEKAAKPAKIRLETLKPGKIKLDPRLGYILVRVGPQSGPDGKPLAINFARVDTATGKLFADQGPGETLAEDVDRRTLSTSLNPGRSFGKSGEGEVYLLSAYPGSWVIHSVAGNAFTPTCLSMGSYGFEVKAGEISDIGLLLTTREDGKSRLAEFKDARLSTDLVEFGTLTNIVMTDALYAKPADDEPALPAKMAAMPRAHVALTPDVRFPNVCKGLPSRALSLPALPHQAPLTAVEAAEKIAAINPETREQREARKAAEAEPAS